MLIRVLLIKVPMRPITELFDLGMSSSFVMMILLMVTMAFCMGFSLFPMQCLLPVLLVLVGYGASQKIKYCMLQAASSATISSSLVM